MSAKATAYAFHHVVLPPKLPQQDDSDTAHDLVLLEIVIKALDSLKRYVKHDHVGSIMAAIATVENLRTCRDHHGNISESQLQEVLTKTTNGTVGAVPLEVKEQNAGVLVSYSSDGLTFEFFELSPTNEAAMSSGRLVRDFPGYASKIPTEDVNPDLIESISRTLATMATQTAPGFQPQVKKNNKTMAEERDTAHPGMVTDFMMNIITALGDSTNVQRIKKHTREEVLWSNCLSPWRRSPLWLLLRVSLQLLFARRADTLHADDIYKAFMIFMLAELLDRAQQHVGDMGSEGDVGGETIQLILAKLTRRLRKLELLKQTDYLQPGWAPYIQDKMTDAHTLIEEKWKAQIGNCQGNIDFSTIAKLKPKADVDMELSSLDAFLSSMKNRQREVSLSTFTPTSRYPSYEAIQLPSSLQSSDPHEDRYFRLAAFERWVEYHLTDWTGSHLHDGDACARLRAVMTTYYDIASRAYAGAPVGMSIMYLVLTELWIACDRIACTIYPLLAEYDPEVDLKELQCLMLPLKNHLNRLNVAECYVQSRRHTALKRPSIYRDFGHSSSFAVRYFDRQETLQAMLSNIEVDAATKRQAKCEELARLKREYQQYMNRYNSTPCETRTVVYNRRFGYTREEHSGSCSRCAAKRHADNLTIQIFEWPVSSQVSVAKATVFELVVPESYGNWRDASAFLITTVLGYKDASPLRPSNFYTLDKHHGLTHLLPPLYSERRIIPLSDIKSYTVTHRKHKKAIPHLDDDDVCLKNALRYAYYDSSTCFFNTNMPSCTLEVSKKCNYPMPKRSKTLERFMCRPPSSLDGLPANEVIASLFDCPTHFSIDEYKALSALPLGHSIIYPNILAQLAIPSVDWTKVETQCIVLQTVQQTGPSSQSIERSSHSILREPSFGRAMLEQLETNLDRIRENWESWRAAATFSLLARRLLSLASASDVRSRALNYLEGLRNVCLRWLRRLKQRVAASTDDGQRTELYSRATEVALLCSSTYDVEETEFGAVLQQSSAISILLQSSIVVQEHCGSMQSEFPELFSITLQSWKSLMGKLRILPTLRNCILANDSGLSDAVKANWAAFESNSSKSWTPLNGSNQQHWMLTTSGSLSVHFNMLTGELLVNGLPLARLPADYMRHEMYEPLFHKSALEVVPTDEIGFNFSAKTLYHGYKLHFGMKDNDMLLCAVGDKRRLEMVPSRLFQELLPQSLVTDAVHWYDSEAEEVIFRPLQSPWSTSDDDSRWRLVRRGTLWRLVNNEKMMINIRSPTARVISSMLAPLEKPLHIHTSVVGSDHPSDSHVQIELIRLQISFEFRETDHNVRSRQFRDMIIDSDQTMGALVGMRSRLILRSADGQRIVLIPEGSFNFTRVSTHHPEVSILEAPAARVRAYNIDETLGQITGDGSLRSRLILCYLHALTSHCLPDTLTGCTGTESAISILRSAAVRSVDLLTLEDVNLLNRIASVSAARSYYPQHLKVMQSTEWDKNLPSLSQHASLRSLVSSLLHQAAEMSLFHPDKPKIFEKISETQQMLAASSNTQLDQRSSIRTATYQVASFGAEEFTSSQDSCYDARDNQGACNRSNQVHIAAKMVLRNRFALHNAIQDLKSGLLREHFANATVSGVDSSFDPGSLQYDSKWLGAASERIKEYWCTLQRGLARAATDCNRYDIMTWLCTMAYAEKSDMDAIQALAAAYRVHELSAVKPPTALKYELNQGHDFNKNAIRNTVLCNTKAFADSNEASLPKRESETEQQHHNRMYAAFQGNQTRAIDSFVENLKNQWPRRSPSVPSGIEYSAYLDVFSAATTIRNQFGHWFNNRLFMQYLGQLSEIMARQPVAPVPAARYALTLPQEKGYVKDTSRHFSVLDVFAATPLPSSGLMSLVPPCEPNVTIAMKHVPEKHSQAKERLEELCRRNMLLAKSKCERDYVESLQSSCVALDNHITNDNRHDELLPDAQVLLQKYLRSCREYLETFSTALNDLFDNEVAYQMRLSPRICTKFWLSQLHRDQFDELSSSWKKTIVQYALAVTNLQRAQRLVRLSNKPVDLIEELRHHGHSNWDVHQYPETLLIEAESGILVRKEQEYIASQMRSPKENVVLQLLMGGGKSTTILPILSAFLGDKKKLVRVVVAKPQSKQMLQMLIAKLGGLLNRRIYQMPFSRNLRLSAQDARTIRKIYEECIRERGVLLIQPEHILSFKLMAVECVLIDQSETAQSLLATQQWFDKVSCDCIDESDENFSVKFELIYTMGSQQSIELAPERWLIIQDLLALIPPVAKQVKRELPEAVDIQGDGDGRYPRVRFLRSDAADRILDRLATRVVDSGIGSPSRSQSRAMKAAILHYISVLELRESEIAAVEQSKFWTETTKPALLLLRGLFAGGVLRFIYTQKRYRVNFGLDNYRTPSTRLAVPYRSKDAPSPRSEFSHTDVVIILTLLAFYYTGLSDDALFDTLIHVLKSDQAVIHYDEFVSTASSDLPKPFRQLSGLSIRDRHQCITEVFPGLRFSRKAIDYYLSYLVFPKELKQFPSKLSASGWDLAIPKPYPSTGFSGTNDTLHLLPLGIQHLDLPSQHHTNAQVLSYLLMDETSVANLPVRTAGSDGEHLIAFIEQLDSDIRVILDCGASILEQNNRQVAETWLKLRSTDIEAVLYFEDEELSVLDRSGKVESFQTSPYAKMLDSCVVYLDESHTRGTDIAGLPRHYRAALTLGSQLTKDRLTQAAMRLRKLGHGQSVCFIIPEEIRTKIYERTGKPTGTPIEVQDVLAWAIGETWSDLKKSLPLWAVQGNRFESHKHLLLSGASTTKDQAEAFLEDEAASLETRYKPRVNNDNSALLSNWDMSNRNIVAIVSRCRDFEAMGFSSAALSEEQERELAPEIEEQRQVERPPRLKAYLHNVHANLKHLVNTGEVVIGSKAWGPAFQKLNTMSAGKLIDLSSFPDELLVTADFMHTVQVPPGSTQASFISDSYQRPVQFLLTVPGSGNAGAIKHIMVISPHEANHLLPLIRRSEKVTLHIFAPRSNTSYASIDELMLYNVGRTFSSGSVSRSLTLQLNLFAGTLYLRSVVEYKELCDHLGLLKGSAEDGQQVYADGFIDPPAGIWGLKQSPVPFLRVLLMKIRREGEGVEKTHMGKVLSGVRLEESDFVEQEE